MSRVIVKNVGKNMTEKQIAEHFSSKGEVTDVRLPKKNGRSRLFAFVGFRTNDQAESAIAYFNNTFMGTSKITVDAAKKIGDTALVEKAQSIKRAKMRNESGVVSMSTTDPEKDDKSGKNGEGQKEKQVNKLKQEFMDVMKERKTANVWGNDEHVADDTKTSSQTTTVRVGSDLGSSSDDSDSEDESDSAGAESKKSSGAMSDLEFLKQKTVSKADLSETDDDDDGDESDNESESDSDNDGEGNTAVDEKDPPSSSSSSSSNVKSKRNDDGAVDEDDIEASGRLFIRNLPFSVTEDDIMELFQSYGQLTEVHVPLDAEKGCKGFGFVQFMFPEHAEAAQAALDGEAFQGRLIHVIQAKTKLTSPEEDTAGGKFVVGKSAFQRARDEARKKSTADVLSWNANHIRSDAIMGTMANEFGLDAGKFMDAQGEKSGEIAVRMALGEAHVQRENKSYFAKNGVNTSFFDVETKGEGSDSKSSSKAMDKADLAKRSSTCILVKNLPSDTDTDDLLGKFSRYGTVTTFLVPPSKTLALVDFQEPTEARKAFSTLAYRKYKHVPLYLEWAPRGVLEGRKETKSSSSDDKKNGATAAAAAAAAAGEQAPTQAVYIKNINFETTQEALANHVSALGFQQDKHVRMISLPANPRNPGQNAGYGFVEFCDVATATLAAGKLTGTKLAEHVLDAKLSGKKLGSASSPKKGGKNSASLAIDAASQRSCKLVVRNVAFQATEKEVKALFTNFGAVKRVRVPKKVGGGGHRGFAFVDFTSHDEAAVAAEALSATHLYGRHLVIEWAKDDDTSGLDVASLRTKAAGDAKALSAAASKKRKERSDGFSGGDAGDIY